MRDFRKNVKSREISEKITKFREFPSTDFGRIEKLQNS